MTERECACNMDAMWFDGMAPICKKPFQEVEPGVDSCTHCSHSCRCHGETEEEKQRTDQQRKALEVFCRELASVMNAHGIGMKVLMEVKELDIPMDQDLVKAAIFRPICNALTGGKSTKDANTQHYSRVHQILCQKLPEAFKDYPGFIVPAWPSRFGDE